MPVQSNLSLLPSFRFVCLSPAIPAISGKQNHTHKTSDNDTPNCSQFSPRLSDKSPLREVYTKKSSFKNPFPSKKYCQMPKNYAFLSPTVSIQKKFALRYHIFTKTVSHDIIFLPGYRFTILQTVFFKIAYKRDSGNNIFFYRPHTLVNPQLYIIFTS